MTTVFVDGAVGTVGRAIEPYLADMVRDRLIASYVTLPEDARKDESTRRAAMAEADIIVLCLPDDVARSAALMARAVNPKARILDASAAHRCDKTWVYGLEGIVTSEAIALARFVANPGCFATASVLAAAPLAALFGRTLPMSFHGITGYSAAGNKGAASAAPYLAQFGLPHRHLPEIAKYGNVLPTLTTLVGNWYKGMLVQSVVDLPQAKVLECYQAFYAGKSGIRVVSAEEVDYRLDPQACNDTNDVLIAVGNNPSGMASVAVVLDNLGKGSAGNAANSIRLMVEA
ncbi:N-acetyl-gamma-glutamyl-phosphate reductase [Novimethylophilus kurashikiensis]|uniref:N-acetyl-gamma-glutamyl-phosphate reductase n=1 Tax=Novimethylophilus kurashikiensis TaxID=1825523 RepID=A0A2R5FCP2_9PROT|nr:hypothetical protein [Novimethylophilus kurashikiensis]GBG14481.1 N-acetyl-gamma-glutamyl-phosphate reductase [Novimethylophilus kurashikiensis]